MNEITPEVLMQMVATIIAGIMSNPANGQTEMNVSNLSNTTMQVAQQVQQGLNSVGIQIVSSPE